MQCVFNAGMMLAKNYGIVGNNVTILMRRYELAKALTHGNINQYTYGGAVPFILRAMFWPRELVVQHRLIEKEHYLVNSGKVQMFIACWITDYGDRVDKLTLEPAVYLSLTRHHAEFLEQIPSNQAGYTMAIRLKEVYSDERISNRSRNYDTSYITKRSRAIVSCG